MVVNADGSTDLMPKITKVDPNAPKIVQAKTKNLTNKTPKAIQWWTIKNPAEKAAGLLSTAAFLKEVQQYRFRHANLLARLYSNYPMFGYIGTNFTKMVQGQGNQLPADRPTMNVIQSCIDTLHSRVTQSRPRPLFLTDGGDYRQRNLAKQLNNFIAGEFYQTDAYKKGEKTLKHGMILGDGVLKVIETEENRVGLEPKLSVNILFDTNDDMFWDPRTCYEYQLVDRSVLGAMFPKQSKLVSTAIQSFPDANSGDQTASDLVMVVEGWHLPSIDGGDDGEHVIACSSGILNPESMKYKKNYFPFEFMGYNQRILGTWSQGLAEMLMGTQLEINKLLLTITRSIHLVGVPRVFVDESSKVVSSHINDEIGAIIKYRGMKPSFEIASCMPQEVYAQLERLVGYAYQQSGLSQLAASSIKPAGLNSGEAIRNYDDLQSDRFAALSRRYDEFYVNLAHKMIDLAKDIAERDGTYQTVYPGKDGTKKIDLPSMDLLDDDFVIQCFDANSLPRDPAGRQQRVTEMVQAGMIDMKEGRRLINFPDLEQVDKLANASEERIYFMLDSIIERGDYNPPDPFLDLQLALQISTQYYNLYAPAKLEKKKAKMLRNFNQQVKDLIKAAMPPAPPVPASAPTGQPAAKPVSQLMPVNQPA